MHFFDISTSKSALELVCFVHFDFEMCFAPQRRALFRHRNFKKCSEPGVFCTLLTSTCASCRNAVHFFDISTSKSAPNISEREVSSACSLAKCASCHSGAQFFISHLASWLSAPAALASLLFDPPEPQIIGKTRRFATFLPFRAPGSSETVSFVIFFLLLFFSLTLPISAFHLSILSEV